ncbi:nuclear transport factor 2 family protein [Tenacibaculum amylolyticum]|uniref:nuclear transport factor 2 family protein n=1 Tax=Tenacibaculum amylolyticum TaxID=104269 RepID=UPI003893974B
MNTQQQTPTIVLSDFVQEHWTPQESENVAVVVDFFQHLMNEHNFEYTLATYGGGSYTQHNRAIPNEMSGLVEYVKTLTKRFPEYSFDVKRITADGDFVVLHSHTTLKAKHRGNERKGFIITDTFQLKNGKLTAHWDAIQPIDFFTRFIFLLTGGAIGNNNPTF